jgi:hypothetical protein
MKLARKVRDLALMSPAAGSLPASIALLLPAAASKSVFLKITESG